MATRKKYMYRRNGFEQHCVSALINGTLIIFKDLEKLSFNEISSPII